MCSSTYAPVFEAFGQDDVHHGEGKSGVGPGTDRIVAVREPAGAILVRIDGVELGPVAPGFDDERPEMDVGTEDVGPPGDDEFRVAELFGLDAVANAQRVVHAGNAGGGTDGAVEPRCAETVKEAAVHAGPVEKAHGAGVAVGQDRFGAEFAGYGLEFFDDFVEGFVP